jgi:hypothetical protein
VTGSSHPADARIIFVGEIIATSTAARRPEGPEPITTMSSSYIAGGPNSEDLGKERCGCLKAECSFDRRLCGIAVRDASHRVKLG